MYESFTLLPAVRVALRNWRSTLVRLAIAPFLFVSLIWLVNQVRTGDRTLPSDTGRSTGRHMLAAMERCQPQPALVNGQTEI